MIGTSLIFRIRFENISFTNMLIFINTTINITYWLSWHWLLYFKIIICSYTSVFYELIRIFLNILFFLSPTILLFICNFISFIDHIFQNWKWMWLFFCYVFFTTMFYFDTRIKFFGLSLLFHHILTGINELL